MKKQDSVESPSHGSCWPPKEGREPTFTANDKVEHYISSNPLVHLSQVQIKMVQLAGPRRFSVHKLCKRSENEHTTPRSVANR